MAFLFPIVMVPVLSNNNVSTSPAVSTALPDLVITLALNARSIPAIPIAERSPPIVVGIKQTNKAINEDKAIGLCIKSAIGFRVVHTITKTSVNPDKRMVSAISLGVFLRDAPSTNAIILSRKLSPGCVLTLTVILSDNTFVPPVTEDLSPPASLITGALSPVMALSSIEARPSTISPSAGIISPASQIKKSPFCN